MVLLWCFLMLALKRSAEILLVVIDDRVAS